MRLQQIMTMDNKHGFLRDSGFVEQMTTTRHRILILGHGEMGQAMAHLLKEQQVDIWEKFPLGDFQSVILEDAASHADIALFCLPVNPHREIVEQITPYLRKSCVCGSIAKGLDEAGTQLHKSLPKVSRLIKLMRYFMGE